VTFSASGIAVGSPLFHSSTMVSAMEDSSLLWSARASQGGAEDLLTVADAPAGLMAGAPPVDFPLPRLAPLSLR
jgi:hypothetical protein